MKRIAVTGGAGQIAYSLLFRLASGELFGDKEKIALHILEVPQALKALDGVVMELHDCAYPLLQEIKIGHDPHELFEGVDLALLVGAKPRSAGMERKDLLDANGKIFIEQGKALNNAAKGAKVLVVGNPCNTNCLIAKHFAKELSDNQFFAMTKLDENRAKAQLAIKSKSSITDVKNVCVWGNHSATQVPDVSHATIQGKSVEEVISDTHWLQNEFMTTVQKRGAEILEARGKSSAASAAHAAIDTAKCLITPTPEGEFYSVSIPSEGNPYGVDESLVFSYPCRTTKDGVCEIVGGLEHNDFIKEKIAITQKELLEEKECVAHLLT